jgi:hypothetical protein
MCASHEEYDVDNKLDYKGSLEINFCKYLSQM